MKCFMKIVSILVLLISVSNADTSLFDSTGSHYNRFHISIGYGVSFSSADDDITTSFTKSGFSGTYTHYFGTTVYPNSSSEKWISNFEVLYRWTKKTKIGIGFSSLTKEKVVGIGGNSIVLSGPQEDSKGNTYYIVVDYLFKSVEKLLWSKWEVSTGIGLSLSNIRMSGYMGTILQNQNYLTSEPWEFSDNKIGVFFRMNLDYYLQSSTSIQLRVGAGIIPSVNVPKQTFSIRELDEHSVSFSNFEIMLRLALHF